MLEKNASYGNLTIGSSHLGNINDVNIRMKEEMLNSDLIIVEDLNEYKNICNHFNINPNAEIFIHNHELANHEDSWKIAEKYLLNGKNVLLMSAFGMPNIADIGSTVTRRSEFGMKVMPRIIPGPSMMSATAALVGFDTTFFTFIQSLPRSKDMRIDFLEQLKKEDRTFMFFNKTPEKTKEIMKEIFDCFKEFKKVLVGILINITENNEKVIVGTHFEVNHYLENSDINFSFHDKVTIIVQNYENFDKNLERHKNYF